jgi:alpha-tubulin suppressor-like RCC1 family protein
MSARPATPTYAALLALLLTVLGAVGAPPGDADVRRATAGALSLSDARVAPGATVTLSGSLPPKRSRTVKLQRKSSGSWVTVTTKRSSSTGRFSFAQTAPASGQRVFRVLAPATTLSGKRYAAVATPSRTLTVVRIVRVDAGQYHACGVGSDGSAWCWGDNTYGELGDGTGASFDEGNRQLAKPVRVSGGRGWAAISTVGGSTCGLKSDHSAWCWGDHALEVSGVAKAAAPVKVDGSWRQVATGYLYACGVHTDGTGWCWGQDQGELGSEAAVPQGTKYQVPGDWTMIVPGSGGTGSDATCGVKTDHTAWCWGDGAAGKLGDDDTTDSRVPVQVAGDHQWSTVTVGATHACGIDTAGAGWCWGDDTPGELGDGTAITERHTPVQVSVAARWTSLDAGLQHTCGVTTSGAGWCWGWNDDGQLGDGTHETGYYPDPKAQLLAGSWTGLAAGSKFSVGATGGTARAWGDGTYAQTGTGAPAPDQLTPRKVAINP